MSCRAVALSILASLWVSAAVGGPYDAAAAWVVQQPDPVDGSWGSRDGPRCVRTEEAVAAPAEVNRHTPDYYAGRTWLQNHQTLDADHLTRTSAMDAPSALFTHLEDAASRGFRLDQDRWNAAHGS